MHNRILISLLPILFLGSGCKTQQARRVETSGFLRDYSQLKEGESGEALLVYRNPRAVFGRYHKVLIDSVTVWRGANSDLKDLSDADALRLTQYFRKALTEKLAEDYEIVERRGPGVLRLRMAITEAAKSWVVADTLTTAIPQTRLLGTLTLLAAGTGLFVGKATVEGELLDSMTGERLLAAADRRHGSKVLRGVLNSWSDVESSFDYWAERLRDRLREERRREEEALR